jgi:hypothetical protein
MEILSFLGRDSASADAIADNLAAREQRELVLQKGRTVVLVENPGRAGRPFQEAIRDRLIVAGFVLDPRGIQARSREQRREGYRQLSANESAAIGDVRTVISAQAAYQASNAGFYEARLPCLASPTGCIPQYPPNAPTFLDPQLTSLQPKSGYARAFHPGPVAPQRPAYASETSVLGFAYSAVPVKQGETGVRSFCGDARGAVMFCSDGRQPPVSNGSCVFESAGCAVLQ